MSTSVAAQRGSDLSGSTAAAPGVEVALRLSPRAVVWLADHPQARRFVRSVWDTLAELDRTGQCPGAIDALRRVLTHHRPTATGRCRTCRRVAGRRRPFPCIVWHQIRGELLGQFTDGGRHRQPTTRT
jgi:hypothetical protein